MFALLRKDVYVMGRAAAAYAATWLVMAALLPHISKLDTGYMYYIMPACSLSLAMSAVSYDEECRWDRFAAMTPLRPWVLVLEKYLFAYGLLTLITVLGAVSSRVFAGSWEWERLRMSLALILLGLATVLPVIYRFGRRKGGALLLAFWGTVAAAILGAALLNYGIIEVTFGWMDAIPAAALEAGLIVCLLAASALSYALSVRFYRRRQRGWYGS